jgi:hypothetical protein
MGRRQCELEGCTKWIQFGGTPFCKAHGGGKRCQTVDCTKGAAAGGDGLHCVTHGGGPRCAVVRCVNPSCTVGGGSLRCLAHNNEYRGGGVCADCDHPVVHGATHCTRHAGARCANDECDRPADRSIWSVAGSKTLHCPAHGGDARCHGEGCESEEAPDGQLLCDECASREPPPALRGPQTTFDFRLTVPCPSCKGVGCYVISPGDMITLAAAGELATAMCTRCAEVAGVLGGTAAQSALTAHNPACLLVGRVTRGAAHETLLTLVVSAVWVRSG